MKEQQIQITIPLQVREELNVQPGDKVIFTLRYEASHLKYYEIARAPISLFQFEKKEYYRVSQRGQVTIPKQVIEDLELDYKDEVDMEYADRKLILRKGYLYQFRGLIVSLRPTFFDGSALELLTILTSDHPDEGEGRTLRVNEQIFTQLQQLYGKLKEKYEPESRFPWVGIMEPSENEVRERGISITFDQSTMPNTLTLQKIGAEYLSNPLIANLWQQRVPFILKDKTITYKDETGVQTKKIDRMHWRSTMLEFQRYAKSFKQYCNVDGHEVDVVELYTGKRDSEDGDLIMIYRLDNIIHYLPKQ
ncbi:AbrB/MazE/SpoVT family DNA-binding domain-containing protein [Paenibacillus sp. HB172176]|uniref:AbrB/MazE/SpoVT family DNA-binding domain-containing protein n=1 Tax=Paenibacillus sp. HB172176 TaxID=2493690 RepID=UPI00143B878A|nr:AbrB/MazE/SpoVT family DNA-binding domain-containing protein [Paenibacillus sp. HB172176]